LGIELLDLNKKSPKSLSPAIGSFPYVTTDPFNSYGNGMYSRYSPYAKLSTYQIEVIYETVSIIRAIHDSIEQKISSLDWNVISKEPDDPALDSHIRKVKGYLEDPNDNDQSLQEIISLWVKDILKFDVGVGELPFNRFGEYANQIYPQNGAEFYKIKDRHGILKGYVQRYEWEGLKEVYFRPEQIIYMNMYSTTKQPNGIPKMTSIVDELAAFVYANDYIRSRFDKSQIPAGILVLENATGETGTETINRMEKKDEIDAQTRNTTIKINRLFGSKANWIELKGADKSEQMIALLQNTCKQIFAAYGVSGVSFNQTDSTNRATAIIQKGVEQSTIIRPIVSMVERYINQQVVWKHWYKDVQFVMGDMEELDPKTNLDITLGLESQGIIGKNEARKNFVYTPYTDEELKKAEGVTEQNQNDDNNDDVESKEEKETSEEMRNQEGTNKSLNNSDLLSMFQTSFKRVQKNLIGNLTRAYFGSHKTNNEIYGASNSLFGTFKSMSNCNDTNPIRNFTADFESSIRTGVNDYKKSIRTKKWQPSEKDKNDFRKIIKKICNDEFYLKLNELIDSMEIE